MSQPLVRHDPNERNFTQLYRDPSLDVWLICWDNAQDTGYDDHDQSSGAVYVCAGMLGVGQGFDFPASDVHGVHGSADLSRPERAGRSSPGSS